MQAARPAHSARPAKKVREIMNKSAEEYIKTLYILKRRNERVRSVDIARELGFSRASVSAAVTYLRNENIIVMQGNGELEFTDKGERIADHIYERHKILSRFLCYVAGVDEETTKADACGMGHFISERTYKGIKKYIKDHPELKMIRK